VINHNWDDYKKSIMEKIIKPMQTTAIMPSVAQLPTTKELETKALELIGSSDALVTKLGEFAKINSQNLMLLQILLGILNIMLLAVL
jgi:hypothetical protein